MARMDLAAFLAARLGEDEAAAKAACEANWYQEDRKQVSGYGDEFIMATLTSGDAAHIARWDPARVLREVAAKRAILKWHPSQRMRYIDASRCPQCELTWPCPTVRHLAAVYRDDPDYDPAWAPV